MEMKDKSNVEGYLETINEDTLMEIQGGTSDKSVFLFIAVRDKIIEWLGIK